VILGKQAIDYDCDQPGRCWPACWAGRRPRSRRSSRSRASARSSRARWTRATRRSA
jgi:hypothetical protein